MEYGIFQEYSKKNLQQGKYWNFWNMEYNRNYQKVDFPCKIEFFVGNINYVIFQKNLQHKKSWIFWNMEYSKKSWNKKKVELFGIWNIPGIFQKNIYITEVLRIMVYEIFHEIFIFQNVAYFYCFTLFLEYSWNIPYSKIFDISVVDIFYGINIPYFKNPKKSWGKKSEFSIFYQKQKKCIKYPCWVKFLIFLKVSIFHKK